MDRNCRNCKLGCGKAVPGHGSLTPKLIVVSDYPGKKEVDEGIPMVGKNGMLMRMALQNVVGLDVANEVFFTNVLRCYPKDKDGDDIYGPAEIVACKRNTNAELAAVQCNLILVAGSLAFETLLPQVLAAEKLKDSKFNLSKAHGSTYTLMGKTYVVTWNPGFIETHVFKRRVGGTDKKPVYENWYPTGSIPWSFIQDLKKLKTIIEASHGTQAHA